MTLRECEEKGKLETENGHERDKRITFEEEGHKYFIDGVLYSELGYRSSTTFLHDFFPPFDTNRAIGFIMRSPKYTDDPEYRYYRKEAATIKAEWAELGRVASEAGTKVHADIEYYLNDIEVDNDSVEFTMFLTWKNDNKHLIPYRTEMLIYDEVNRITGSIDAIYWDPFQKHFVLVDWKRSKAIKKSGGGKGYFPLEHLNNANFFHYSIQLSLYRNIFERLYGMTVGGSVLVVIHPNQKRGYQQITVPYLKNEIEQMLQYRQLSLMLNGFIEVPDEIANDELIRWDRIRDLPARH